MKLRELGLKIKRDDYDKICKIYLFRIPIYIKKNSNKPGMKEFEKELGLAAGNKKNVLFVTHDFSLTGAPLAVFNTAVALSVKYNVFVIGFNSGVLFDEYQKKGINAYVDKKFDSLSQQNIRNYNRFDFVFTNTVLTYNIVRCLSDDKPYLWRIAEGTDINKDYIPQCRYLAETLSQARNLYAVSLYTQKVLLQFNKGTSLLLYGIKDVASKYMKKEKIATNGQVRFAVIGTWGKRKAQELILEAYRKLPKRYQDKAVITFIGSNPCRYKDSQNIKFTGPLIDNDKYEKLASSDILLCPSLDDPNPQVVMEGMMLGKPCLISDAVGQKDYITDGMNGWVVKAGDVDELSEKMMFIIDNPSEIKRISPLSRKIYEELFCFDKYLENVEKIIEGK